MPGIIPVVGQLDDAVVVLLAIRHALTGLPPADREAALARAGLDPRALDDDLRTIGMTYAWLGRRGARITWRSAKTVARVSSRLGRSLAARVAPRGLIGTFGPSLQRRLTRTLARWALRLTRRNPPR